MEEAVADNGFSCPCCKKVNITFLRISAEGVHFICNGSGRAFITPDKRGGYLPHRALLLKQKFSKK